MNPNTAPHFPWTTSLMVFLIDKNRRILLEQSQFGNKFWKTFRFDTPCRTAVSGETLKVSIQEMVCDQLKKIGIYTKPVYLKHFGICDIVTPNLNPEVELETFSPAINERLLRSIFVYTIQVFRISELTPIKNLYWYTPSELRQARVRFLERQFLLSILNCDQISKKISSEKEALSYLNV